MLQEEGEEETETMYLWLKGVNDELGSGVLPPNFTSQELRDSLTRLMSISKSVSLL